MIVSVQTVDDNMRINWVHGVEIAEVEDAKDLVVDKNMDYSIYTEKNDGSGREIEVLFYNSLTEEYFWGENL